MEDQHLQAFHYFHSYRAARSSSVPVLKISGRTLADSTDILQWCDSQAPKSRKLLPADPKFREEAGRLEDYFDEELGVAGRLWIYSYLLREIPLVLKYSRMHAVPGYEIRLMPILFPVLKKQIERALGLTPTSGKDAKAVIDRVFDEVARKLEGKNFLVADTFTSADLTFAALSASVLIPGNYGVRLPELEELPEEMRKQVWVWRQHPAGQFALRIYHEFRGR